MPFATPPLDRDRNNSPRYEVWFAELRNPMRFFTKDGAFRVARKHDDGRWGITIWDNFVGDYIAYREWRT
jgi:hypothetical protein